MPGRARSNIYPELDASPTVYSHISPERHRSKRTASKSPIRNEELSEDEAEDAEISRHETSKVSFTYGSFIARESPLPTLRNKTPAPLPAPQEKSSNSKSVFGVCVFVAVLAILAILVPAVLVMTKVVKVEITPDFKADCSEFLDLVNRFPNQDRMLFKSLKVGVEGIINGNPPEASVFSLFSTDQEVINKVMSEVIRVTMHCINQSQDPINLSKDQLSESLVDDYKHELERRNIMIVNNVNDAASGSVPSLHSFCDTYNPLVLKSIIFFTMKVPSVPTGKPVEYIFQHLRSRWADLESNKRDPLITRMVDQTFFLKP